MTVRILVGDCREVLRSLPSESVHCIVSSPPYWRQRDYGVAGQIGLEQTPENYVAELTDVMREARRVLRSDGTCWINIGDKWASGGNGGGGSYMAERADAWAHAKQSKGWRSPPSGYKHKDLIGVPFMLAFAMRADGWYWRQCNIWAKPNGMPESVSDRSTISHEYVLQFSKSEDYWYNSDAARTPPVPSSETRLAQNIEAQTGSMRANGGAKTKRRQQLGGGSNLRSVWWIAPAQFREGHYAVMPDMLAEICIVAGCPPGGVVLDPFGGAGTTGLVADRLQRNATLIELNPEYARMAERRIRGEAGMLADVHIEECLPQVAAE